MLAMLDQTTVLTGNQKRIIVAVVIGNMLEFFDYFLIGFVLAFIVGPWKLTIGQTTIVLLSSGIGAILGSFFWGYVADRVGRRKVMVATVLIFSLATGALALTPENGWIYLTMFRLLVGFGVGGLFSVDLPLLQEFMPTSKRGPVGGLVTAFISVGLLIAALCAAFLTPIVGWRGLFALGLLPAALALLIRAWVPESPYWLLQRGRVDEARKSLAWALQVDPSTIPVSANGYQPEPKPRFSEIFRHPRSLLASWIIQLGGQTGGYGVVLWAPTLFVLLLKVTPAQAALLWVWVGVSGLVGRFFFAWASEAIGRKTSGALFGFGAAIALVLAAAFHTDYVGTVSLFWVLLMVWAVFGDGGLAIAGPYAAEVWPSSIRATGMGSAYGFGGIGKIIGPLGLALIIGSSSVIKPDVSLKAIIPAFLYFASFYVLAGLAFVLIGFETKGMSILQIDSRRDEYPVGHQP
jgi:MFS transporter, putative metabolite:H+ symporter